MNRAFLTGTYLVAHLATAAVCISSIIVIPIIVMLIVAIVANDPGGPLFFPISLVFLAAAGLAAAAMLSLATAMADFARSRWRIPLWLPPLVAFSAVSLPFVVRGSMLAGGLVGLGAAVAYSLYWLAVSTVWFLARLIRSRAL